MGRGLKITGIILASIIILLALDFGFGYVGVFKTKTVKKAQQDAERDVFESTQSYVDGKIQEANKMYIEFQRTEDEEEKEAIRTYIRNGFANFNEQKYLQSPLKEFVYNCKYKIE